MKSLTMSSHRVYLLSVLSVFTSFSSSNFDNNCLHLFQEPLLASNVFSSFTPLALMLLSHLQ